MGVDYCLLARRRPIAGQPLGIRARYCLGRVPWREGLVEVRPFWVDVFCHPATPPHPTPPQGPGICHVAILRGSEAFGMAEGGAVAHRMARSAIVTRWNVVVRCACVRACVRRSAWLRACVRGSSVRAWKSRACVFLSERASERASQRASIRAFVRSCDRAIVRSCNRWRETFARLRHGRGWDRWGVRSDSCELGCRRVCVRTCVRLSVRASVRSRARGP